MKAMSMAPTFSASCMPSPAPVAAASMTLPAFFSTLRLTVPLVTGVPVSGKRILAMTRAAGAAMTLAASRCTAKRTAPRPARSLRLGQGLAEHLDIGRHDAAGDGGHAADHDRHELGLGHRADVGLDQQRRLGLADEDVGRGGERLGARGAHELGHEPGDALDHLLQDAEVVEHRGQRGDEDDRRQHLEGEVEAQAVGARVGRQAAKDELGALGGEAEQADNGAAQPGDEHLGPAQRREPGAQRVGVEDEDGEDHLDEDAHAHQAPADAPAVVGEQDGDAKDQEQSKMPLSREIAFIVHL